MTPFLPFGAAGVFREAAIVCFAYGGFDNIATMAEETKNPSRDIPIGLLGSMSIITVIYCLMALSLTMMQKYRDIDLDAAYPIEFQTALLVGALGQARYTTHIARAHMIPPWFALVHPKTGTPINATLLIAILAAVLAFFSSLGILSSFLSVSTLFIFMMMAVALLMRRYYTREITPQLHLLKLVIFLLIIIASSIGTSAYWGSKPEWLGLDMSSDFLFGSWQLRQYNCFYLSREHQSMGSSTSSMASIVVNCNKYLSYGIFGTGCLYKIWDLYTL
ncbi:hypothetical protein Patl1_12058 [Pistacia atlantica]|uniref:Uncharacterized protein n=1 Tax=Pistacia atlantica TaxID=434234 RepID=A0ACC1A856_9ROSI|nr:hypothetical protein Patl1_12058 [Pistacia atlantica]